jgi:hypothetical protein
MVAQAKVWQDASVKLGVLLTVLIIAGMIWTAGNTFETKSDHDRDMESERRYLHEYIKRTADESADKAVEKWIIRRGK